MGNVNVREDGEGSPSPNPSPSPSPSGCGSGELVVEDEEEDEIVDADVGTTLIPHSPPRAGPLPLLSPLKFGPQNPIAPIQKPGDIHIHTLTPEDVSCVEQGQGGIGIPTMITWTHPGNQVSVEGSWDNWKTRKPLQRSGKEFTLMKVLPCGVYQYRFVVDAIWRYAPDLPWAQDEAGNYYNILDLQDYVPEDTESISGFEPPQSPDCSYDNSDLGQEDFAKEPPLVPPHLHMTLLNVPSPCSEMPPPLSRPQHVVLNHLYMQKGKSGPTVVALGATHRFKSKYVTVVLYKSL